MAVTTTSTIGAGVNTFYDKKFLKKAANVLRMAQHGQKRPLPKGTGKTIEFFRYNSIPVTISGLKLTEGTNPNETSITGQKLQAVISEWGAFSKHSSLLKMSHIDRNLSGVVDLWGEHAGKTVDLLTQMEVAANGAYPLRADGSVTTGAYYASGTATAATSTSLQDTDVLDQGAGETGNADNDYNQSIIVITGGTGKGQARAVTGYVASTETLTVSPAWDITPDTTSTYVVVSAHGLTSGTHILTTVRIQKAVETLKNNGATPMSDGFYIGILDPTVQTNLMADTTWKNLMQYSASDSGKRSSLFTGKIGEWGGVRWYYTTQPFRFPIGTLGTAGSTYGVGPNSPTADEYTNYSSTGAVHSSFILGQEAFGVTTFKGQGSILKPGIKIKNPGPSDTSNPLDMFSTAGWYLPFVAKALNPLFAVQIWSTP